MVHEIQPTVIPDTTTAARRTAWSQRRDLWVPWLLHSESVARQLGVNNRKRQQVVTIVASSDSKSKMEMTANRFKAS